MTKEHKVIQGECLSSIAKRYGFGNWRTIYNGPQNADFRRRRPNPNLIYPGDRIYIPNRELKEENAATEQRHCFQRKAPRTFLRIVVRDENGQALARRQYRLWLAECEPYEDTTHDDGLIEHEIPADAEEGELTLWPDEENASEGNGYIVVLKIGHLDPVEEITGVQARLNNLGFDCGSIDGVGGPRTKAAVRAFQEKYMLTVDGIPGPETQAKLKEVYGC